MTGAPAGFRPLAMHANSFWAHLSQAALLIAHYCSGSNPKKSKRAPVAPFLVIWKLALTCQCTDSTACTVL